jgi:Protein of unknown function (DUF3489)
MTKSNGNSAAQASSKIHTTSGHKLASQPSLASNSKSKGTTKVQPNGKSSEVLKAVKTPDLAPVDCTEPNAQRTTKQELILTLLSRNGGAGIDEIMRATGWQQHSVRGFFAGTVRKKLGFDLTSEKAEGSERRYAIKVAA